MAELDDTTRTRPRTLRWAAVLAVAVAVVLAGCGLSDVLGLQQRLGDAGYPGAGVELHTVNSYSTITVDVDAPRQGDSSAAAHSDIAGIVWTTYPARVDEVHVVVGGSEQDLTWPQLYQQFGQRPAGLEQPSGGNALGPLQGLAAAVGGVGHLVMIAIALIIVLPVVLLVVVVAVARRRQARRT